MEQMPADPGAIDFIYGTSLEGVVNQLQEMASLDTKLVQVFGAASVVLGLASVASDARTGFLVVAAGAYALCAVAAFLAGIWVQKVRYPFHSETLIRDFWPHTLEEIRYALADEMPEIWEFNNRVINRKVWAARIAIAATAVEVAAIGGMVIWTA